MYRHFAVVLALLVSAAVADAGVDAKTQQLVKKKVEDINEALVKGNYATIVDLTHESLIKKLGGREKAIAEITKAMDDIKAKGATFRVVQVDLPKDFATVGDKMFVVVPFSLEIKLMGQKITTKSYLVGVSTDKGKTWTFIGADAGEAEIREHFPDLPASLKLPKVDVQFEKI
jgi:hypothetical protein